MALRYGTDLVRRDCLLSFIYKIFSNYQKYLRCKLRHAIGREGCLNYRDKDLFLTACSRTKSLRRGLEGMFAKIVIFSVTWIQNDSSHADNYHSNFVHTKHVENNDSNYRKNYESDKLKKEVRWCRLMMKFAYIRFLSIWEIKWKKSNCKSTYPTC